MGRRWGKTTMAGACALAWANACGHAVAWVVPTYKNARAPWRFAESACREIRDSVDVLKSERTIKFPSGGWLGIYTADNPVGILGEAFDAVIVDEAARIPEDVWSESILPTLADREGVAMLISTPRGRNWFWREWLKGTNGAEGYHSWQAPSSANPSPRIKRAAEQARERVSDRTYRQEWLAEFIDDGGGVFRGVRALADAEKHERAQDGHQYVIGVDWGRSYDATVFCVMDATTRSMAMLDRMTETAYNLQTGRLRGLWERFDRCPIIAEANSMGGPLIEQLSREGLRVKAFTTTNATKAQIIDDLALAFERQTIRILNDALLIGELEAYESERTPSGMVRYSAPEGLHDDTVMALALAYSGIGRTSSAVGAFG